MISERLIVAPPAGWPLFARSEDVVAHILAQLTPTDHGGIWRYYGLTSCTSVWSSDTSPVNDLYLSYSSSPTEHPTRIKELVVVVSDNQSEHFKQLQSLIAHFTREFELSVTSGSRNA